MSDPKLDDVARLQHIYDAVRKAINFTSGRQRTDFSLASDVNEFNLLNRAETRDLQEQ